MPPSPLVPSSSRSEWQRALPVLLSLGLVWLFEWLAQSGSLHVPSLHYIVIHSAFEVMAMVLAALSFALLWMAPVSARRLGSVLLASALAGAALLDFLHMLSYEGMPELVTPSGPEKSIAFWLAGRLLLTAGMLGIAFAPTERRVGERQRALILLATLLAALAPAAAILLVPEQLPRTFIAGAGLSPGKVAAELLLAALLLVAALRLQQLSRRLQLQSASALAVAAALSAVSELCAASYATPSDLVNLLGHVAKLSAYWYVTRATYLLAVRQPLAVAGGIADALKATLNPALICSEQGTIRWVNPAFVQTTGLQPEALVGQDIEVLRIDGDTTSWEQMRQAMRAGKAWKGLAQARRRDGQTYIDDRSLTPMHGPQGHVNGFVMLGDDITERERVARSLRASEERLRVLLESAPDAVVVIDAKGTVQMANPAVERMFGYSSVEIIGRNVSMLMLPDVARTHDGSLRGYQTTGVRHIIGTGREVLAQRKDGRVIHVHLTIGEADLPDGVAFIGFMRDVSERIRAESELAEREERYRALMDTAIDGVWICDAEGRLLAVNDAYCQRSGYGRSELLHMRIADLDADESSAQVLQHVSRVMERGHDKFETRHRDKSGRTWPVEITVSYWPLGKGQLFVFVRDLSEQHAAALALRQSEERFELALRGTNDGLWDRDLIEDTIYYSPRWKGMLGYSDEELSNRRETFAALLHPSDNLAVQLALSDIVAGHGGERFEIEMRLRHKDGHWVHVLSRGQLVRDPAGRPVRLIGTHQDLSERKLAEAALRESEDKLRNLFELSPLGIALCTLDGRLIEFNEAYRALTGYTAEQLRGLSYWDLTPTDYMRSAAAQLESVTRTGRYGPFDKEYQRADGSRVPVRLNGVRIEINGQPHLWSIAEDLTESRRVEAERQALQRQQLQSQKLEALGHLTGGIAHDFNNMLAGIMGLASLGLDRYISEPDGKLAQYLREIVRTSERGRDLVAKMLAYVRTEEPASVAPRHLGLMVGEMCEMLRSSIPSSIALSYTPDPDLPPVRISAVDMQQIVMNLVINARDAVGTQGHIELRLAHVQAQGENCSNCAEPMHGDCVLLEVRDDGCGIPAELLPNIFDPFFTTKDIGKGTGLGLSSVIGLVHKAGGHLQVQSLAPQGTLMRVWLPAAAGAAVAQAEPALAPPAQAGAPVWVVDDDPAVLVFLTELLREHGYRVAAFTDPRQALQALQQLGRPGSPALRPAALITDQTMPGLSGAELARAAMAELPQLPVILCTGYSEQIDADSARALGVRQFLRKPFDSRDLLAALAGALNLPGS